MLIDEVTITIAAGNGGDGTVAFNKNKMELGPTGATGGNGGNVYCHGVADIGALAHFRNTKEALAGNGETGGYQYRDGKDGADIDFPVPVGTVNVFFWLAAARAAGVTIIFVPPPTPARVNTRLGSRANNSFFDWN